MVEGRRLKAPLHCVFPAGKCPKKPCARLDKAGGDPIIEGALRQGTLTRAERPQGRRFRAGLGSE